MEAVMDTFDDEAFHGPDMKTKAQCVRIKMVRRKIHARRLRVQTFEVLVGVWKMQNVPMRRMTTIANISLFYSLSNEMNVFGGERRYSLQQSRPE
ncbi:hypothetical protein Scep_024251 [Stephania cephalantha]|uniref:Uncharacterized protein n=1 Tax=Stephania cephalantha TaxID=152367 RepID=A0AAP0EW81_9MAGN